MIRVLYFILISFITIGCGRNAGNEDSSPQEQLPAATQTGANTFGCMVDGKLFYPRDGTPSVGSGAKAIIWWGSPSSYDYSELDVNNFKDGKPVNNFIMHLQDIHTIGIGEYVWKESNFKNGIDGLMQNYLFIRAFDYSNNTWKWYGSYENSGKTIITKYGGQPIISGTFSGKLKSQDGNSEISITNGRFDIDTSTIMNQPFP